MVQSTYPNGKETITMGMTDKQFAGFLRLAIRTFRKALTTKDPEEAKELIAGLLEDMQATLED